MKPFREQYLDSKTAAALIGVSTRTLRRWKDEGTIEQNQSQKYGLISLLFVAIAKASKGKGLKEAQCDLAQSQTTKTKVEIEILEIKRGKLSDSLLDTDEANQVWEKHQERVKGKLNKLISELPERLEAQLPSAIVAKLSPAQKRELASRWEERVKSELKDILE